MRHRSDADGNAAKEFARAPAADEQPRSSRGSRWLLFIFGPVGVWSLVSAVTAFIEARPIGGLIDVCVAAVAAAAIAQDRGWTSARNAGIGFAGAFVSWGALLATHAVLANELLLLIPASLVVAGGLGAALHSLSLMKPERQLPTEIEHRARQLPGVGGTAKATLVLRDGRRVRNVLLIDGRIGTAKAARLFDPTDVVDVLPEPYRKLHSGTRKEQ